VSFRAQLSDLYRANLWLRTASRVVVRIAEFEVKAFHELERLSRNVPWEEIVAPGGSAHFKVTCRKSRLYHSDAVAMRIAAALEHRVAGAKARIDAAPEDEQGETEGSQLFTVRILRDRCTISADSSGLLLHQRGYRQASGKAPVRETLAAAMLLASEWKAPPALLDPMCGSGTIPIEAALIARRIAPGLARGFSFMTWPDFDAAAWTSAVDEARARQLVSAGAPIQGSDRDAGVIAMARANAERAGVAADVDFRVAVISDAKPPTSEAGWVITNPPYGVRVGDSIALRDLYAQLGNVLRERFVGGKVGMLSADHRLDGQLRLPLTPKFETHNGGIPVRFLVGDVPTLAPLRGAPAG
jgi:putative N6-adenine-specific DNA methylase